MKRSDIVRSIQVQFKNMRAADAAAILDAVSEQMIAAVADGNRIEVRGFRHFSAACPRNKNWL